jgi:hypothetical protein
MYTSSFKLHGHDPRAVAISATVPTWYHGNRYQALAPPMSIVRQLKRSKGEPEDLVNYTVQYSKMVLHKTDGPQAVYNELCNKFGEDCILLCWCPPGTFCHRWLLASWFKNKLGVTVSEITKTSKQIKLEVEV